MTERSGLGDRRGFSTSALWFDYDRDGLLDLFVCNYVKWSPEQDVFCSLDGKQKSYCTPEAYRGATCWLFRNRGNGTFEDVTATSGIFDSSSKSLGVTMLDYDWTAGRICSSPTTRSRTSCIATCAMARFRRWRVEAGVAFSEDGKARAGMGVDAADYDNSGIPGLAVTNFDNEMLGFYRAPSGGLYIDAGPALGDRAAVARSLGFGCFFFDADLDGLLDLLVVNGHIDDTVRNVRARRQYAQPPHLFLNSGGDEFRDVAAEAGGEFAQPKVGRGAAFGDFDNDGDLDVLITTNHGPAHLYRNDQLAGNRSIRLHLVGTKSNRDAIGATVRIFTRHLQSRMVKSGLELSVAVGAAGDVRHRQARPRRSRVVIHGRAAGWRSSRTSVSGQPVRVRGRQGDDPMTRRLMPCRPARSAIWPDATSTGMAEKTEDEWRATLTPEQFQVLRDHGTERAGTEPTQHEKRDGDIRCAGCGHPCSPPTPSSRAARAGPASGHR